MRSLNSSPDLSWYGIHISQFPAIVFGATAILALLPYQVTVHRPVVIVSCALMTWVSLTMGRPRGRRSLLTLVALEYAAVSVIVGASDGAHSPFSSLYLVLILECSLVLGPPWGLLSAALSSLAMAATEVILHGVASLWEFDRVIADYPFFFLVGVVTSSLSAARSSWEVNASRLQAEQGVLLRDVEVAAEIQRALLPQAEPVIPGWDIAWRVRSHRAVGGDLVQFVPTAGGVACAVADVTGKGISAATLVGTLHQTLLGLGGRAPCEVVSDVNQFLCRYSTAQFAASLIVLELSSTSDTVTVCNAGHPYPMVCRSGGRQAEEWVAHQVVAGWVEDAVYRDQTETLRPGDTLLLYTDGLTDVRADRDRLGEQGIRDAFEGLQHQTLDAIADSLVALATGEQVDDVTVLVIRRQCTVVAAPASE